MRPRWGLCWRRRSWGSLRCRSGENVVSLRANALRLDGPGASRRAHPRGAGRGPRTPEPRAPSPEPSRILLYNQPFTMTPEISVVVPMRNEAASVPDLYRELTAALDGFGRPYEIIAIDDGSTDETFRLLAGLQRTDPRVRVVRFRRNFGQTAAFSAGFAHARGRFIVTSDGDLQNDPRDIPEMVRIAEQRNADIVAGWRRNRKDAFINRRLPSMIANWVISRTTGVRLHDYGCSLKVFRAEV